MSDFDKKDETPQAPRNISTSANPPAPVFLPPRVPIVFCGAGPCLIEGPRTGEMYYFSPRKAEQLIDAADAAELMKTPLFRKQRLVDKIPGLPQMALQASVSSPGTVHPAPNVGALAATPSQLESAPGTQPGLAGEEQ